MDGKTLAVYLIGSVLLNVFLFRLSMIEYYRRRKTQREAAALSQALRSVNRKPLQVSQSLMPLMLLGFFIGLAALAALWFSF